MRNHIHQYGPMSSRYSNRELKSRRQKHWYRNLKASMNDDWVTKDTWDIHFMNPFSWLYQKIKGLFKRHG